MSSFTLLLLTLLIVPLVEIYFLIAVGRVIGAGSTILVVVVTAVIGAWLLRLQGLQTLNRLQDALGRGELPAAEMVEGLILLVTGVLLLTPGFFTDGAGFLCLVPAVRAILARRLLRHFTTRAKVTTQTGQGRVIDGDYRREDES